MNRVWDLLDSFLAINFIFVPKSYNQLAYALASRGACYNIAHYNRGALGFKVQCRPLVLDAADL